MNKVRQLRDRLRREAGDPTRWNCAISSCTSRAIDSHLLQQNGILSLIASSRNEICEFRQDSFDAGASTFRRRSVGRYTYSFPGFCPSHDQSLFAPVERTIGFDLSTAQNCLLLAFRAMTHEYWKKRRNVLWYDLIERESGPISATAEWEVVKEWARGKRLAEAAAVELGAGLTRGVERAILRGGEYPGSHIVLEMDRIDVCVSAYYSLPSSITVDDVTGAILGDPQRAPSYAVALVPRDTSTIAVVSSFDRPAPDARELTKNFWPFIDDVLTNRIETWACSCLFYDQIVRPHETAFLRQYHEQLSLASKFRMSPMRLLRRLSLPAPRIIGEL